jgi:hypothetical protein
MLAGLCCFSHLGCAETKTESIPAAIENYPADAWCVSKVDVQLGNVMYSHPDIGMYDREYSGVVLTRGNGTITLSYGGLLKQNLDLLQLKVGDLVRIETDLDTLYNRPLGSYQFKDVVLKRVN